MKVKYGKGGQDMVQVFKDFEFSPFDGNPFIGSFEAGKITFEFDVPVELGDPLALSRGRLQVSSAVPNGPERPATQVVFRRSRIASATDNETWT